LLQIGVRLSECATLTFKDITFDERGGMLRVRAGKGNKARAVPLNASAREALAVYLAPRIGAEKPTLKAVAASWPRSRAEPLSLKTSRGSAVAVSALPICEMVWPVQKIQKSPALLSGTASVCCVMMRSSPRSKLLR